MSRVAERPDLGFGVRPIRRTSPVTVQHAAEVGVLSIRTTSSAADRMEAVEVVVPSIRTTTSVEVRWSA